MNTINCTLRRLIHSTIFFYCAFLYYYHYSAAGINSLKYLFPLNVPLFTDNYSSVANSFNYFPFTILFFIINVTPRRAIHSNNYFLSLYLSFLITTLRLSIHPANNFLLLYFSYSAADHSHRHLFSLTVPLFTDNSNSSAGNEYRQLVLLAAHLSLLSCSSSVTIPFLP